MARFGNVAPRTLEQCSGHSALRLQGYSQRGQAKQL